MINVYDLVFTCAIGLMGVVGYRRGALASLIAAIVVMIGAVIGGAVSLLIIGDSRPGVVMLGLIAAGGVTMRLSVLREFVEHHIGDQKARQVDRAVGAVGNSLLAVIIIWFVGVVLTLTPPPRGQTNPARDRMLRSTIMQGVLGTVTPTGNVAALAIRSGLVPALDGPLVIVDPPDDAVLDDPEVVRASASVLQIKGKACRQLSSGTGWVAAPQLVVTNAHVVAGQQPDNTGVQLRDESGRPTVLLPARIVGFDPVIDIAVLYVPDLDLPPLRPGDTPRHDESAAIIGFPGEEGMQITAARYDRTLDWDAYDIYEKRRTPTRLVVFGATIRSGNSGSPLLDTDGNVQGTITSGSIGQSIEGGYAVPNDLVLDRLAGANAQQGVDTGPCIRTPQATEL